MLPILFYGQTLVRDHFDYRRMAKHACNSISVGDGHNWRFVFHASFVELHPNDEVDRSNKEALKNTYINMGCALENFCQTAHQFNYNTKISLLNEKQKKPHLRIYLSKERSRQNLWDKPVFQEKFADMNHSTSIRTEKCIQELIGCLNTNPLYDLSYELLDKQKSCCTLLLTAEKNTYQSWIELGRGLQSFYLKCISLNLSITVFKEEIIVRHIQKQSQNPERLNKERPILIAHIGCNKKQEHPPQKNVWEMIEYNDA